MASPATAAASCDRNIPAAECLFDHVLPHLRDAKRAEATPGAVDFFGGYDAICPAHDDERRSLRISVGRTRLYLKCYAGCDELAIRDRLIRDGSGVPARCLPITQQRKADLVEQLTGLLTNPDLDHGHKVMLALACLRGRSDLPRGAELEELAGATGVSRSRAFDYGRAQRLNPTSGSYGSRETPVKHRRSSRSVAPLEKSDGRNFVRWPDYGKSDSRTRSQQDKEASRMTPRPTALLIPLAAIAFLAAACSSPPQQMTVHGTLEIAVQTYDEFRASYPAATNGNAQVTITDPSGKVIAVTTADDGNVNQSSQSETLTWGWTAKVPAGLSYYGISVTGGNGAPVQFTQAQMKQGPGVCIGDAC